MELPSDTWKKKIVAPSLAVASRLGPFQGARQAIRGGTAEPQRIPVITSAETRYESNHFHTEAGPKCSLVLPCMLSDKASRIRKVSDRGFATSCLRPPERGSHVVGRNSSDKELHMIEISTFPIPFVERCGNPRPPHAHGLHHPRFEPTPRAYRKREGVGTQPSTISHCAGVAASL